MVAFKYKNGTTWTDLVLPVANGGSGLTSAPSILTNLESATAVNVFQANPRPGVIGTLPIAKGGTGANDVAGVRDKLQLNPYVLWSNSAGTKLNDQTVTLTDNPENYNFIEIFGRNDVSTTSNGPYWSECFDTSNLDLSSDKVSYIQILNANIRGSAKTIQFAISSIKLTKGSKSVFLQKEYYMNYAYASNTSAGGAADSNAGHIFLHKIIGWK